MVRSIKNKIKTISAEAALISLEVVIVTVLFFAALLVFVYMVRRVFILDNTEFDQTVYNYLGQYVNSRNNQIMLFFTFLGKHQFLIPANIILILYFLFVRKHKWYSLKVASISLSSLGLMFLLKHFFSRPRPLVPLLEEAKGLSFPSGHALMSVTFYGLLGYMIWHSTKNKIIRWGSFVALIMLMFIIGTSRIYLHVHYTSDVIAGYCMGVIWLIISIQLLRRLEKYSSRKMGSIINENPVVHVSE
jgi:membrane-associated phospholipid phosphatase